MHRTTRRLLGRVLLLVFLFVVVLVSYEQFAQTKITELSQRLLRLRQQQQETESELARLRMEAQTLKLEVQEARAEAERSRCEALEAQINAEVIVTRVECLKAQSEYAECDAKNSAKTSNGGLFGCVLGLGAAALTGGAALPLTAAGCAGGAAVGASSQVECGERPTCTEQFDQIEATVLSKHGLTQRLICTQAPIQPVLR
jgi:hypothetical protein